MTTATQTIALPPRLTMAEARATLAQLSPALAAAPAPVIDASALQVLDSAAVALLLACHRQAAAAGKSLTVVRMPDKLVQLARLYGVAGLLGLAERADAAPAGAAGTDRASH